MLICFLFLYILPVLFILNWYNIDEILDLELMLKYIKTFEEIEIRYM